ncbi:hypothetical protein ACSBR1_015897 [Camellia fascicularis]
MATDVDWEDFIIETLLLHQVEGEEEIDKGHYNTLLDLHVFNSGSIDNVGNIFSSNLIQMRLKPLKKGDKRCTCWQQIPPTISIRTKFGWSKRKKYNWNKTVWANIEHQLQTMGADIKQLCSEFVQDVMPLFSPDFMEGVAPELSPRQNKNVNLTTHESSMIGVEIDPKKGLCNKNSSAHRYCMEPVEEKHNDLLSKKKDNIGMSEKLNVSVMKNDTAKKPFPTEIPVVVDTAEKDSSLASLFCGVNKSDDERWDGQEDLPTPVSLDGYHSCMKEGETTNHVNATDDNSNLSPANVEFLILYLLQVMLSQQYQLILVGLGLSYPIKFLNQKTMFPLQILPKITVLRGGYE